MKIGEKVYFQFDDNGVIREAGGVLIEIDSLGWYVCQFMGSNIQIKCLPYAVRPIQFSQYRLRDKIKQYGYARVNKENSGSMCPEDAELARSEFVKARETLYSYIKWL